MKLVYTGPYESVDVPDAGVVAKRGESVEITGDLAQELLKRDEWRRVDRPKTNDTEGE